MILLTKVSCRSRASRAFAAFLISSLDVSLFASFLDIFIDKDVQQIFISVATFKGVDDQPLENYCSIICIDESLFSDIVFLIRSTDFMVQLSHLLCSWFDEFAIFILTEVGHFWIQIHSELLVLLEVLPCSFTVSTEIPLEDSVDSEDMQSNLQQKDLDELWLSISNCTRLDW